MNILLTSVGRRSYLVKYFKEALGNNGEIHVSNSSSLTPAFSCADKHTVTPLIYDKNYIPFLLNYCENNSINAIISLFDIDLPILSENKQLFSDIGVNVIVSSKEVIDICNDKLKTYKFLISNGFNVPKTYVSLEDVFEALKKGRINYPLIIKPRWGMGSIGVYEAVNDNELKVLYSKTLTSIKNSYLKFKSQDKLEESIIIQEKLSGQEYGLDVINDLSSKYQNTIVKIKYAMCSGETDCAKTVESKILKKLGKSLSDKLCHIGNLDVDVFMAKDTPYILEMNARFGGGYPFSHMAGVNLPKAIIHWLNDEEAPKELLKEEFEVLSHKDINIKKLKERNENTKYIDFDFIKVESKEEIIRLLNDYDFVFEPSISSRIKNFENYADKLINNAIVYVAKSDKNIGFIIFYANDKCSKTAYITFLGVIQSARNSNVSKELLDLCFNISKENGMDFIKLEVRKNNSRAINFYKNNGFEFCGEASKESMYMIKRL